MKLATPDNHALMQYRIVNRSHLPVISVFLLCAAIVFAFAPGHMDADVLGMLGFVRTGIYTDWYPLVFPALLKICVSLGIGPVGVLLFQVFAVGLSTYAIIGRFSTPLIAAIGSYCVLLCPAVLGYLGALTSHALVAAFILCAFATLLYLDRPMPPGLRIALFVFSFAALSAGSIARVNAAVFTLPGFFIWAHLAMERLGVFQLNRALRLLAVITLALATTVVTLVCGNAVLSALFHPVHTGPVQGIAIYDISAISLRANRVLFDRQRFPSQNINDLRRIFVKNFPDPLIWGDPSVPRVHLIASGDQSDLMRTWRDSIAMHPAYYITERWQMFRGLLGLDFRVPPAVPFHPGIDGNQLGYHIAHPTEDALVVRYLKDFQNTIVDRPFVYLILLVLAGGAALSLSWGPREARFVLLALGAGNLLYVAGDFVATPSTFLRYIWPSIVISMVISVTAAGMYIGFLGREIAKIRDTERRGARSSYAISR